jgi:1-acyl-sn-glycerol-3-phosphate acyltransferase
MPADGYSPAALRAFRRVFEPWRRRRLEPTAIGPLPDVPDDVPLLLVANHVSWWDGFALLDVRERIRPRAPFRVVMTEAELRRFPFFRLLGCLPVREGSRVSIRTLLRTLGAIRAHDPTSIFVWFPQGAIWPSFRRPLGFRRGIERVARRLAPVTVLPVGIHCEPLNRRRPTFFVSVGAPMDPALAASTAAIEAAVGTCLDGIHEHRARHGEAAAASWPSGMRCHATAVEETGGTSAWNE